MTTRFCDCGCGEEFPVTGNGTQPLWQHPDEGGKVFASEACKERYLTKIAHLCIVCKGVWLLDGKGVACSAHCAKAGELIYDFEAGIPGGDSAFELPEPDALGGFV